MAIAREDLDAGRIDFSDVADPAAPPLDPVHPGDILKQDFLEPLGLSVYALADALHVPRTRLNDIVLRRRAVTADTALRLARYFGTSPGFWMGLQAQHDLAVAQAEVGKAIAREVSPRAA